jgi:hypothetical protein
MKSPTKTGLKIFGLVVFVGVAVFFCAYIFPIVYFVYDGHVQMKAGAKYMNSLTEKDFQVWIDRTEKYLAEYDPKAETIGTKPVPPELKQLKILRIDVSSNWVGYVWMGGFDHTVLFVKRLADGEFQFKARYNDKSDRVIWPKTETSHN